MKFRCSANTIIRCSASILLLKLLSSKTSCLITKVTAFTFSPSLSFTSYSSTSKKTTTTTCFSFITSTTKTTSNRDKHEKINSNVVILPESYWRNEARKHKERVRSILQPGMILVDDPRFIEGKRRKRTTTRSTMEGQLTKRQQEKQRRKQLIQNHFKGSSPLEKKDNNKGVQTSNTSSEKKINAKKKNEKYSPKEIKVEKKSSNNSSSDAPWTSLDPLHPIFNFMIEYYNIRGAKGCKRLARWSPDFSLLLQRNSDPSSAAVLSMNKEQHYELEEQFIAATNDVVGNDATGILLLGATPDDVSETLHLKGATFIENWGLFYSPAMQFDFKRFCQRENKESEKVEEDEEERKDYQQWCIQKAAPYQWYATILNATLTSTPILHCNALHEWAMQYHPDPNSPPPPSSKYQRHIPLRVTRDTINAVVERRGIDCTHVDALRFFAPSAGSYNRLGSSIERCDQIHNEQKGCLHAHMDLLKMALRLQPFLSASVLADCLEMAIEARRLDVAASPYDCSIDWGIESIPIERAWGRKMFQSRQIELMKKAEGVRKELLGCYYVFLGLAFEENMLEEAIRHPAPERFAKTEPGGLPWRKNLI